MAKAGTSLVRWEEEMARRAKMATGAVADVLTGNMITLRNGVMKVNDSPVKDNMLDVVILDNVIARTYYKDKFDSDDIKSPICYAFGREAKTLKPHDKSGKKQNLTCKGCWADEFDTNDRGGKACQERQRLAVLSADFKMTGQTVEDSQIYYLHVPVTSVRGFAVYTKKLAELLKQHPMGVVTTVELVPDERTQFKLTFEVKGEIKAPDVRKALLAKADEAEKSIFFAYPEYKEGKGKAKKATKPTGKKGKAGISSKY